MQRWAVCRNNYWYTGDIELEVVPWYLLLLEYAVMTLCGWLHYIDWLPTKELRENYGGVGGLFHFHVCEPIMRYVWKRTEVHRIDVPYFILEGKFPDLFTNDDYEFDEEDSYLIEKNREEAKKQASDYRKLMNQNSFESRRKRREEEGDDL